MDRRTAIVYLRQEASSETGAWWALRMLGVTDEEYAAAERCSVVLSSGRWTAPPPGVAKTEKIAITGPGGSWRPPTGS